MGQVLVTAEPGVIVLEEQDAEAVRAIDAHTGHRGVGFPRPDQHVFISEGEIETGVDEVVGQRRSGDREQRQQDQDSAHQIDSLGGTGV